MPSSDTAPDAIAEDFRRESRDAFARIAAAEGALSEADVAEMNTTIAAMRAKVVGLDARIGEILAERRHDAEGDRA